MDLMPTAIFASRCSHMAARVTEQFLTQSGVGAAHRSRVIIQDERYPRTGLVFSRRVLLDGYLLGTVTGRKGKHGGVRFDVECDTISPVFTFSEPAHVH